VASYGKRWVSANYILGILKTIIITFGFVPPNGLSKFNIGTKLSNYYMEDGFLIIGWLGQSDAGLGWQNVF